MAVLYRKYRSKSLDELVGQDHITRALSSALKSGSIAHAYLFTGPRGTGKTSVARILAHEINNLPYDETTNHLDIIEIDAASNRRIDEMRDLRDKVHIAPTSAKYKVYIIDEVHMLTKEAFNALLKTLEEPPDHVVFILATTELHKVPDTIVSRTQRFSFKPIDQAKIVEHLRHIAKKEAINIDDSALMLIAQHSTGGFRDAISLLDQVKSIDSQITADTIRETIGMPSSQMIEQIWSSLTSKADATSQLQSLYEAGYHAPLISKSLLEMAITNHDIELAKRLLQIPAAHDPKSELLLLTLEYAPARIVQPPADTKIEPPKANIKHEATAPATNIDMDPISHKPNVQPKKSAQNSLETSKSSAGAIQEHGEVWEAILSDVKEGKHAVYGPLRLATATISNESLRLGLAFPFHVKRVSEPKNIELITEIARKHTGQDISVEVYRITSEKTSEPRQSARTVPATMQDDSDAELMTDPLSMIKNVFGDAQVL